MFEYESHGHIALQHTLMQSESRGMTNMDFLFIVLNIKQIHCSNHSKMEMFAASLYINRDY